MPIVTLPVFEAEADPKTRGLSDEDVAVLGRLRPPETVVVRYGYMRHIAELPCQLNVVLGCGEKLVSRTPRGTELAEMLTTTCANAGCGKSLTRKEMLTYIEQSGGRSYPFTTHGRVLRQATPEDLNAQAQLEGGKKKALKRSRQLVAELGLEMRIVEVEPILGQEQLTFYYTSEDRVDFRELVRMLAAEFATRIEMRQVGARDEARLVADYERCGQHCCCRQFLKVLKPVSMRSAKMQKATLDPLKISGRCGRLMCCLRYEDQTYQELKKNLPHRRTRVGTPEGPGLVIDSQILTQLVLVELEHNQARIAVPIEELMDPDSCPTPAAVAAAAAARADPLRAMTAKKAIQQVARQESQESKVSTADTESKRRHRKRRGRPSRTRQQEQYRQRAEQEAGRDTATTDQSPATTVPSDGGAEMSQTSTGEHEAALLRSGKGDEADSGPQQIPGAEQIDKRSQSRRRRRRRNRSSAEGSGDGVAHTAVSEAPDSSIPSDSQGASVADRGAAATSVNDQIPDHVTAQTETDPATGGQPRGKKRRRRRRKRKSDRSQPGGGGGAGDGIVNTSGDTGSAQ